jgi:hypothetical protein
MDQEVHIQAVQDGKWRATVMLPPTEGGTTISTDASTIDKALADLAGARIQVLAGLHDDEPNA